MTAIRIRLRAVLTWGQTAFAAERQQQALWLPVAMGAGILLYFSLRMEPDPRMIWLAPPLMIAAFFVSRSLPFCGWLCSMMAACSFGFAVVLWHAQRAPPTITPPSRALVIEGIVQNIEALPQGLRVTLAQARLGPEAPTLERSLRLRLRSDDGARPAPGDLLRVRALIRPPAAPAYPGAWDFQRNAHFSGQGGVGFAIGPAEVTSGAGQAPPLSGLRTTLEARVMAAQPGPAGAISAALLTGSQSAIPSADLNAMRDSGLAHLLSVSGLHIAIVMSVSLQAAGRLRRAACGRLLYAADRCAGTHAAQLRHGLPCHACNSGRAQGHIATRPCLGCGGGDDLRSGFASWSVFPNVLRGGARPDCGVGGVAAAPCRAAWP